jgi:hypothetical protein
MKPKIQQPLKETRQVMAHWRQGSPRTRYNEKLMMKQIVCDFYAINCPIFSMKETRLEHFYLLINFWKKKKLSMGSIINRLSLLRKYLNTINSPIVVPDNKTLKIKRSYKSKENKNEKLNLTVVDEVYHPVTKLMLKLQMLIGLTKTESIRFAYYPFDDQGKYLRISKSVAHNHRDRVIPMVNQSQEILINEFKGFVGNMFSLENMASKTTLLGIYNHELLWKGVASNTNFRATYARERHQYLVNEEIVCQVIIKQLSQELGLMDLRKIRSWVTYEQNSIEKNDLFHQQNS